MPASRTHFDLVPRPTRVVPRPGRFTLDATTSVRAMPGAEDAADLLRTLLGPATGLPLPASPAGEIVLAVDPQLSGLREEGYGLTIGPHGLLLRGAHATGLLRGIQTIRQLLPPAALAAAPEAAAPRREAWSMPCAEITDVPRYRWRGAMLDVARHFQPVSYLRRYVDLLAFHKLNVLHLHLTDDQGWRMPVPALPRLTGIGGHRAQSMVGPAGSTTYDGRRHGGSYTRAELTGLVAYAARRGVTVVPEIEMPGHVRAALAAYPALGNNPGRTLDVWTRWGVCETVLGVHDEVLDFCRTVLAEVMDVFPSEHIHLGGEECPTVEWERSPAARRRVAAEGLSGPQALHGWFMGRIGEFLVQHGRRPTGWAETGAELPPGFTVMSWRGQVDGLNAARRGHDVVTAHYLSTYLDYAQSEDSGEPAAQPGAVVDLKAVHALDPAPEAWESEAAARVLGTQAQLWTEFVTTPGHIEYLAFPRLCALADRAWTDSAGGADDFLPCLERHTARLDALGVNYRPLAPRPSSAAVARTARVS
ncbi:beta-N-acetylhexosaminidase [Streptomyces sp. N2-109]|uniref:beta-N-acetylhexosaminidase n=1 Tax=Streptomyces gossypii TaxID=2883101 RepID=A0ABT2K122_9ACTN|nr:beta-N-acetylhexosaminidase [Streptomyces gossypii]MCT2593862.1 beta-N-acetylhexosaminidase [Streptomyces gossypii]